MSTPGRIRMYNAEGGWVELAAPATGVFETKLTVSEDGIQAESKQAKLEKSVTVTDGVYTLAPDDAGKVVVLSEATEAQAVVPVETVQTTFMAGSQIDVFNGGSSRVELVPAAGVTLQNVQNPPLYVPRFGEATLRRRSVNVWVAKGDVTGFLPIAATGGDAVEDVLIGGVQYRIHMFTTVGSSSFEVQSLGTTNGSVEYLVVGGGSGGSGSFSGGGAAGGILVSDGPQFVGLGSKTVAVGGGGLGGIGWQNGTNMNGTAGGQSEFNGLIALGGGLAGQFGGDSYQATNPAGSGGSGGGGASFGSSATSNNGGLSIQTQPAGTIAYGNNGGNGTTTSSPYNGGGGGGAGSAGGNGVAGVGPGAGGAGISLTSFVPTSVATTYSIGEVSGGNTFFGGGGGGGSQNQNFGAAGIGGGGSGSATNPAVGALNAMANTGGGGGGAGYNSGSNLRLGGNGGSGIVIIRYPLVNV